MVNPTCIPPTKTIDVDILLYISLTFFFSVQALTAWALDFVICTKSTSHMLHKLVNTSNIDRIKW